MSSESDSVRASMRALAEEVKETVVLTREFYRCIVKDPRTTSGQMMAVRPPPQAPVPTFEKEEQDSEEAFDTSEAVTNPSRKKPEDL